MASRSAIPFRAACARRWLEPAIEGWREPQDLPLEESVEVHLLTCARDWRGAAWALASFVTCSGSRWRMVVHDDGTLGTQARETLQRIFPALEFIARSEADRSMALHLANHPRCLRYRETHALALKLLDTVFLAKTPRVILLDSDLLFFHEPTEVLEWVRQGREECRFNPDFQDAYCLSRQEARERLGVDLWERVNTGLSLLPRKAIDLDLCETCLVDKDIAEPGNLPWCEQTLLALCASHFGAGGLLSARYEVNFNPRVADDSVSRHYVGDLRPMFYAEGMYRVRRLLFP
jgi:hypothetical protein